MLRTEPTPFFSAVFEKLSRALEGTKKKLEKEIESAELFANQNLQWRLSIMEIKRLQRCISQTQAGHVVLHPYFLYEKLCHLLDCSELKIPPYDHESLGELFHHLILKIESLFTHEQKDFSFMEFERREASFVVENLPQTLTKGREIYLIIQKPEVQTTLSLHGLKLTSKQRLTHVRHFSLPGISLIPIKKPAFLSSRFADEIDAYIIEQKDEWKKALAEGNLVVFHQDITADFKLYLYWRHSDGPAR
jgi:predicted component of type VI protein secretion system